MNHAASTPQLPSMRPDFNASVHPSWWHSDRPVRTKSHLRRERKKEFIPDPSFDLDGDGIVSQKDLFFASMFDKDRDHKLNEVEKRNALKALREEKFEQEFEFLDGSVRRATYVDKKNRNQGWFSMDDNLKEEQKRANDMTRTKLLRKRRDDGIVTNQKIKEGYDRRNPRFKSTCTKYSVDPLEEKRSSPFSGKPGDTAYHHALRERERKARVQYGLSPEKTDYRRNPLKEQARFRSKSEMKRSMREEAIRANETTVKECESYYRTSAEKKQEKFEKYLEESKALRREGKTRSHLVEVRKAESLALGAQFHHSLRGDDIELVSGSNEPYFALEDPSLQREVYFDKLPDYKHKMEPKKSYLVERRNQAKEVTGKVAKTNPKQYSCEDSSDRKSRNTQFTTSVFDHKGMDYFLRQSEKGRLKLKKMEEERERRLLASMKSDPYLLIPMFSSFTNDNIFREPVYGSHVTKPKRLFNPKTLQRAQSLPASKFRRASTVINTSNTATPLTIQIEKASSDGSITTEPYQA